MQIEVMAKFRIVVFILFSVVVGTPCGATTDNPVNTSTSHQPVRAWHFVLNSLEMKQAYLLIDMARSAGFNTVVVQLTWGLELGTAPWMVKPDAWNLEQFLEWVDYARKQEMRVIPEIKLLTHQKKFFQRSFPDLMFNKSTYDPQTKEVYTKVFRLLDEIIVLLHPDAIHIGHDEVAGHNKHSTKKHLKPGQKMLPADLFLQDVLKIHDYLKQRNIETWMWGDMLISPDEFPEMRQKTLHGSASGYGKSLRDKLPRDIVICDWHYVDKQSEFPSLAVFKKEGFRVLGSTWKREKTTRNFSRYAALHGADGMIVTTWFHVQRKEWDVVDRILKISGQAFSMDFPDAK